MADTTIQKQGEVFISQSEYDALRLAGNLQSNTKYHITKTPKTGVDSLEQMNLLNGDKTVTYNTTDGMTVNGQARFTYDGGTTKDVTMDMEIPVAAGEGIIIDKKANEEKVEIALDFDALNGHYYNTGDLSSGSGICAIENYVPKILYPIHGAFENIPTYETNEALFVFANDEQLDEYNGSFPDSDYYAINVKYARDKLLEKSEGLVGQTRAYTVRRDGNGSYQESLCIDAGNAEWSVAQRGAGGVLCVATPVGVNDATTKAYVDGLHHYSHHVRLDLIPASAGDTSTASICMTVASKNAPNAVASLNDITVTTSLAYLLYYLGDESEGWGFSSTGYIKHNSTTYLVYDLYVDVDYKIEASCINLSTLAPANLVLTDINEQWQVVDFVA